MTSADERDSSWGPPLGGNPTEAADELIVDVDVDEPDELLLDPVEPDIAVLPEQWEVLADEESPVAPAPPPPPPPPAPPPDPPVAVPVLQHVVEAPVVEPELEPEPEPEPVVETESDFVFAPQPEPALQTVIQPAPLPSPEPAPAPVAAAMPARVRLDAELVPPAERATSAMVLLLLSVVVGIALAGLVSAVVLVITLVVRRALGA